VKLMIKKSAITLFIGAGILVILFVIILCYILFFNGINVLSSAFKFNNFFELKRLSKQIEQNPNDYKALYERSELYSDIGKEKKSKEDEKRWLNLNLDDPEYYLFRSDFYKNNASFTSEIPDEDQKKKYKELYFDDINKAIKLAPKNPKYYDFRSNYYAELEDYEGAIADASKSIEFCDKQSILQKLFNYRGDLYYKSGQFDKAISDCNRSLEIGFDDGAFSKRAFAYFENAKKCDEESKITEAIESYKKFLEHNMKGDFGYYYKDKSKDRVKFARERIKALEESL